MEAITECNHCHKDKHLEDVIRHSNTSYISCIDCFVEQPYKYTPLLNFSSREEKTRPIIKKLMSWCFG